MQRNDAMSSSEKIIGKKRLINPVSGWRVDYFDGPDVTHRAKTDQKRRIKQMATDGPKERD